MNRLTLALSAAALLIAGSTAFSFQEPTKKNVENGAPDDLIGGYTIVSGEKYGEKEDPDRLKGTTVRIAEDAIAVLDKEKKELYVQTYKIDTTTKPWHITLRSKVTPYTDKKSEEVTAKGLIEKDGDTVKLIYALPGGEAPTEFKTKEKQLMFVMKNENKTKKAEAKTSTSKTTDQ